MRIMLVQNGHMQEIEDIEETKTSPSYGFYWIHAGLFDLDELQRIFGFHDLAIEDCIDEEEQRPKLEIYDNHYFIVINSVEFANQDILLHEVNIFIGAHYIVTITKYPIQEIKQLEQEIHDEEINTADYMLYHFIDLIVKNYFGVIDDIEDLIEELEKKILVKPDNSQLNEIIGIRSEILYAKKMLGPQRDLISALNKKELALINDRLQKYFGDILENSVKIVETFDTFRDLMGNLREAYQAALANRANETMRVFTALTTIFMPLTIVTGIYGMNFDNMPELHTRNGYFVVLGVMLTVGIGMYALFKKKGWL
ncbi:magnesium/cobalt transporter CorA [Brevibacillus ginsengisoli]|uniref:magnesium/cobalt transporter CorA n=1 Tax=Brevibacillus ginsengisoli TaxID=363854 RepID=UPI003CF13F54